MTKETNVGIVKFFAGLILSNLIRLLHFIPNNDPIMAIMLPYAKTKHKYIAVLFPLLTMVSFDIITGKVGVWTIVTAGTYALLGFFFSNFYFKVNAKKIGLLKYLKAGILGVLIFDFITGPIMSSWMFGMTFTDAVLGQIPFTIMHLVTVSAYIVVLVPLLDKHLVENAKLTDTSVLNYLKQKLFART
ncbi:MAG: hypothetical protein WCW44_00955 [archaeon]|jgi:hypothetical protein